MSTQTPEPQPQDSAGAAAAAADTLGLGNLTLDPAGTSSSTADKYGLGAWGQEAVNTNGLFNLPPNTKADAVMQAFLQAANDPNKAGIVAAIQHALYLAGDYYPTTYTPVSGLVRPTDAQAFAKFLTQTAQTNSGLADDAKKPLATALVDASAMGTAAGTAAVSRIQRRAQNVVTTPSATDLAAVAQTEARKVLGRNASNDQVQRFVNYYQNLTTNYQQQLDQAQYQSQYNASQPLQQTTVGAQRPDENASGVPLSAADQTLGADVMAQGQQVSDQQQQMNGYDTPALGATTRGVQGQTTPAAPLPSPTDFMGQIADIVNAANSSTATQGGTGPMQGQPSPYVVQQAPNASTAADEFLRQLDPKDANANDLNSAMGTFLQLIASGRMQ